MGLMDDIYHQQQMSAQNDYMRQMMGMQHSQVMMPQMQRKEVNYAMQGGAKEPSQPEPNKLLLLTRRK